MSHTLINKLGKITKRAVLIALVSSVIGCSECIPGKPDRPSYIKTFDVSPTSGNVPLEVRIQFEGDDPDGIEEIIEHKVTIDREGTSNDEVITQLNPINISRIFNKQEEVKIYGQITNVYGSTIETNPKLISARPKTSFFSNSVRA